MIKSLLTKEIVDTSKIRINSNNIPEEEKIKNNLLLYAETIINKVYPSYEICRDDKLIKSFFVDIIRKVKGTLIEQQFGDLELHSYCIFENFSTNVRDYGDFIISNSEILDKMDLIELVNNMEIDNLCNITHNYELINMCEAIYVLVKDNDEIKPLIIRSYRKEVGYSSSPYNKLYIRLHAFLLNHFDFFYNFKYLKNQQ